MLVNNIIVREAVSLPEVFDANLNDAEKLEMYELQTLLLYK